MEEFGGPPIVVVVVVVPGVDLLDGRDSGQMVEDGFRVTCCRR